LAVALKLAFDLFDLQPLKLQNRRGELQPLAGLTE
jgi:hypothetical protein